MSYSIYSLKSDQKIDFDFETWFKILNLAGNCGWKPAGTIETKNYDPDWCANPEGLAEYQKNLESWDGNYFTNDGRKVTDEDALALVIALTKALDNIPTCNDPQEKVFSIRADNISTLLDIVENFGEATNPFLNQIYSFTVQDKCVVTEFINLCLKGGFLIW